jgi:hypothetical protein
MTLVLVEGSATIKEKFNVWKKFITQVVFRQRGLIKTERTPTLPIYFAFSSLIGGLHGNFMNIDTIGAFSNFDSLFRMW